MAQGGRRGALGRATEHGKTLTTERLNRVARRARRRRRSARACAAQMGTDAS